MSFFIGVIGVDGSPPFQTDDVKPLALTKSNLFIEARLFFGDQDEEVFPVESQFYLLDESLVKILKTIDLTLEIPDGESRQLTYEDYLEAAAKALAFPDTEESQAIAYLINQAARRHQIYTVKTSRSGKGNFTKIKRGNYYLFGIGKTDAEVFVWHLPVAIKAGGNSIEIDQSDAAVVFSVDE